MNRPERSGETALVLDEATQLVLPGRADLHPRYDGVTEVGIAILAGPLLSTPNEYSPLNPSAKDELTVSYSNEPKRPDAWVPPVGAKSIEEILGGELPDGLGRFNAFALAKMNQVATSGEASSVAPEIELAPGRVGLAGAVTSSTLGIVSTSGLWEIHDHVLSRMMSILQSREHGGVDHSAEILEVIFGEINMLHKGLISADQINRPWLVRLRKQADIIIASVCMDRI